ncbi:MAG: hypothetical protein JW984_07865 [Deltaproteobacteria bacterium]|uniref:Uncharacterized protein n=1 Tax=Candidatus Zymogenus saltonus TaxID=2844893 RepID=A0A9D8PPP7_9DELT|nr:hypothetical protein [Candidatus Zymogenus saltonus]
MRDLTSDEANAIRLQMLYSIGNGWSWYAYKRLGPEKIIELELEMWSDLIPLAVEILYMMIQPEGKPADKMKHFLNQITKVNGYVPKFLEEDENSLKWEYSSCPNWDNLVMVNFDDYLTQDGKPAKVSCIHGCTKIHELYFRKISPNIKIESFDLRPNAKETCVFKASVK